MIGSYVGGCKLTEQIGEGGFGAVYKAIQLSLDRTVAVKILHSTSPDTNGFALSSRLEHPNIVRTYYCGRESDINFLVMEYVEGRTLDKLLAQEGPIAISRIMAITKQLASALAYAHRNGVTHGDLNPRNIIISDERVVIGDFVGNEAAKADGVIGVPEYVSPEQARGLIVTPKSDIYSLGIIIYEMLKGKPPFLEANPSDTLFKQISTEPVPLHKSSRSIPPDLDDMVMRMLHKNPDARPEDCDGIVRELESIERQLGRKETERPKRERQPVNPLVLMGLLVTLGGLGGVGYMFQQSVEQEKELETLAVSSSTPPAAVNNNLLEKRLGALYNKEMQRGQSLLDKKDYHAAAQAFHRAAKLRPDQVDPHLCLAALFIERDCYKYAKQELDVVLIRQPGNREALNAMRYIRSKMSNQSP